MTEYRNGDDPVIMIAALTIEILEWANEDFKFWNLIPGWFGFGFGFKVKF